MALIKEKQKDITLAPEVRNKCFEEVSKGYTEEIALVEASRCLNCKNAPCIEGCPVHIEIPQFIAKVKEHKFDEAYSIIEKSSSLPAICGRVCPQESQCESKCTMGIKFEPVGIGRLERFVADYHNALNIKVNNNIKKNGVKAAIIGSGPSGLTCASELEKAGFSVTIFEALHEAGGVLTYGIPEFRLPKSIVKKEINNLIDLGVEIKTNVVIGKTIQLNELLSMGYKYIFIGSGAGLPKFMGIPGEELKGVLSANEFLTRLNLMKAYNNSDTPIKKASKTIVVGGGNVAMDAARSALRLGSNVTIVYRRGEEELPARREEVIHAKEEGIHFNLLTNPKEILGNENKEVIGMNVVNMVLGEPDESGRRKPIEEPNSSHFLECDQVIMALGTSPNPILTSSSPFLFTEKWGGISVNESGQTSIINVYAGGDAVSGAATVILAMGAGKRCAKAIIEKEKQSQA